MWGRFLGWARGLSIRGILSAVVSILILVLGFLASALTRGRKKHSRDAADTRDQVNLDRDQGEKTDDEIVDEFARKFGPP